MASEINMTRRNECLSELITLTKDRFLAGLIKMYESAKLRNKDASFILRDLQLTLREIPVWTDERLSDEVSSLKDVDRARDLLKAIMTLNSRIYQLTYEEVSLRTFVHDCYLQIGREIWKKPHLLYDNLPRIEYNKNMVLLERIVIQCIKSIIRKTIAFGSPVSFSPAFSPPNQSPVARSPVVRSPRDRSPERGEERPENSGANLAQNEVFVRSMMAIANEPPPARPDEREVQAVAAAVPGNCVDTNFPADPPLTCQPHDIRWMPVASPVSSISAAIPKQHIVEPEPLAPQQWNSETELHQDDCIDAKSEKSSSSSSSEEISHKDHDHATDFYNDNEKVVTVPDKKTLKQTKRFYYHSDALQKFLKMRKKHT
jgi:hypothetical protein